MVIEVEAMILNCKEIRNNKLYDTGKASVFYKGEQRWYFITKKGNYFSAKKTSVCSDNTMIYTFSDIELETEESIKDILSKYDVEKYQRLYGEVEEA